MQGLTTVWESMMKKNLWIAAIAVTTLVGLGGCTQEAREKYDSAGDSLEAGAKKTGDAVKTDAEKSGAAAEQAARNTGEAVQNAAENSAEAAKNAGKEAGKVADNAQTTLAVKNAILSAKDIDAAKINVDTMDKMVHLKGSVPNASQKSRAETLAKAVVGNNYKIKNELTINP